MLPLRKRKAAATEFHGDKRICLSAPASSRSSDSEDAALDLSEEGEDFETKSSPLTPASTTATTPRPQPQCRTKHIVCPFEGCTKSFNRPARLEEHKRSHTNERIFKCSGCDKDFLRDSHLKRHVLSAHSDQRDYVCEWDECGKGFATAQRLKRHLALHEGREKHRCHIDDCGQTFRKHSTLDKHQRTAHQGGAAFSCEMQTDSGTICAKGFDTTYALKLHKGRIHGAKSYWCFLCPDLSEEGCSSSLGFGTYADLQAHNKLVHPPTCEICGYAATTQKALQQHIAQWHTEQSAFTESLHTCPYAICNGQTFTRKPNLDVHIRTVHQKTKSFICASEVVTTLNNVSNWTGMDACGRAFKAKQGLEEHIRTAHLGLDNSIVARQKRLGTYIPRTDDKSKPKTRKKGKDTTLGKLTGTAYTENANRTIPCVVLGCEYKFTRKHDRELHLQSKHGMVGAQFYAQDEDQSNDLAGFTALEDRESGFSPSNRPVDNANSCNEDWLDHSAQTGGPFWIGGSEGEVDETLMGLAQAGERIVDSETWDAEAREMFDLVGKEEWDGGIAHAQEETTIAAGNGFVDGPAPIDPKLL